MRPPWCRIDAIAASGTVRSHGTIPLVRSRTLSVTTRLKMGSSIDADATTYLYYSPDGINWDTIAYTSFALTYSAGNYVQRTTIIDVPEHGFMSVSVENGSANDTITDIQLWYTLQSYSLERAIGYGTISQDIGEETVEEL